MENPSLGITVCHHSAILVMPNGDPRDGFFYPTLRHMINSYTLLIAECALKTYEKHYALLYRWS